MPEQLCIARAVRNDSEAGYGFAPEAIPQGAIRRIAIPLLVFQFRYEMKSIHEVCSPL